MEMQKLIEVESFCKKNDIEISFVNTLEQNGLIEITKIEDTNFFNFDQLMELDRYIRFYYELNVNLEGIDAIKHLFCRVNEMCDKIASFQNKRYLYDYNGI
ncbi:MAG: chaperone modulator CbpM [Bacteroidota bacterium]|nr:chaperone modulator CbpM [Bacteroidota bacterium]